MNTHNKLLRKFTLLVLILCLATSCSAIDPLAYEPPKDRGFQDQGTYPVYDILQQGQNLPLGDNRGPEDIAVGEDGRIYFGYHSGDFTDGGILRMNTDGTGMEVFADTGAWVTGLHFDSAGRLLALVIGKGLMRFDAEGNGELLASEHMGRRFLIPNDIDTDSSGLIYFTVTSHTDVFSPDLALKIILEARRQDGALYRFDPVTGELSEVARGFHFANGVAISPDDQYALVVETGRYRVLKIPLNANAKEEPIEVLSNLPGIPNGIAFRRQVAGASQFWLGFTTSRNDTLDSVHPHPWLKSLVYSLPAFIRPAARPYGLVMLIEVRDREAQILAALRDTTGNTVSEASSVEEYDGFIYLGGDLTDGVIKVAIPETLR